MTVRNVFAERSVCLDKPTRTSLFSIAKKIALIFAPHDEGDGSFDVIHAEHDETGLPHKEDIPLVSEQVWLRDASKNKNSIKALSSLFDFSPRNMVTSFDSLQF
jgi:hypothetical protein